jgi:Phosphodiester glycosidase
MDTDTTPSGAGQVATSLPYGALSYGVRSGTVNVAPATSAHTVASSSPDSLATAVERPVRRPRFGSNGGHRQPVGAHSRGHAAARHGDEKPPTTGRRDFTRGRGRWIVAAVIVALLSPSAWSYGAALAAPGNLPLSVKSVEWLRDHHGRWLVNDIENFWYNHHKPKKGGTPKEGFGRLVPATSPASSGPNATQPNQGVQHLPPPAAIPPIVANPLPGEGQWHPLGQLVSGVPAMYSAYLRPDPVYTSLVTGVAWMDPTLVKAVLYAGVQEPGGRGWRYQAPIAPADRTNLLAAFNSGFKLSDSRGGYFAEGRTIRALVPGAATLAIRADGTPTVGQWGRDIHMGPDIAFARQNLALIVDNGQPVPDIDRGGLSKWGATLGNKVLVWRSGVGVTASGALVFAGGNYLSAGSLARVLARAGAVRAMELDINSEWVDFFTYGPAAAGQPPANLTVTKLLPDMRASLNRYFSANSRDFIAIFRR